MVIETAKNGEVDIAFERLGPPDGTPMVLIPGAGVQMVMWPEGLWAGLAERGFQVVRMDNRDSGLSTHLTRYDVPRRQRPPLYTLRDIAGDVAAVIDALGCGSAHLVGASQGGIFAQATATHHPDRVLSLTSMVSTPGVSPLLNRPRIGTAVRIFRATSRKSRDRDAEGQKWVDVARAMSSRAYPSDEEHWREAGRIMFDRDPYPPGVLRLAAAVFAGGDRRRELAAVRCPTLVMHGDADPLVNIRAGRATADAIPDARFVVYPGMGHELPRELQPAAVEEIAAFAALAERTAAS